MPPGLAPRRPNPLRRTPSCSTYVYCWPVPMAFVCCCSLRMGTSVPPLAKPITLFFKRGKRRAREAGRGRLAAVPGQRCQGWHRCCILQPGAAGGASGSTSSRLCAWTVLQPACSSCTSGESVPGHAVRRFSRDGPSCSSSSPAAEPPLMRQLHVRSATQHGTAAAGLATAAPPAPAAWGRPFLPFKQSKWRYMFNLPASGLL